MVTREQIESKLNSNIPLTKGEKIEIKRGKFFVTSFGGDFIHACLT